MWILLAAVLVPSVPGAASAQRGDSPIVVRQPQLPGTPAPESDAREVRDELNALFQQYPPTLRAVLQRDPTLLTNTAYLAPYPALAAYIAKHPEIPHNPAYFVGLENFEFNFRENRSNQLQNIFNTVVVGSVFVVLICTLGWILRLIMNHRRWLRVSRLQTDLQNKLIERFTSNEEMLSFIQTDAGQRFLEAASMVPEPGPRALSAPIGRMLWSIQLGIVLVVMGSGVYLVSNQLSSYEDAVTGFHVTGVLVIALGIGFILSALGSYLLSRRLGLMEAAPAPTTK